MNTDTKILNTQVDEVDKIDINILRLKSINPQLSLEEIGRLLPKKLTKQAVSKRLQKPKMKEIFGSLEQDAFSQIKGLIGESILVLKNALKSKDERIAVSVAKGIIDYFMKGHEQEITKEKDVLTYEIPESMRLK